MDLWVVFLLLAAGCLLIGIVVSITKTKVTPVDGPAVRTETAADHSVQFHSPETSNEVSMLPNVSLPAQWDEASITRQLQQLSSERPALVPHFVESVKQRWIIRQDDRTAATRLQFLKRQIEQLKLAKEFKQVVDDLDLLALEKDKRRKTLELEAQEIDIKKRSLSRKEELEALREQKKMELEIAQLEEQINKIKNPPKTETPAQRAEPAEERAKVFAAIAALDAERDRILTTITDPDMQQQVRVLYDQKKQRELEKITRL